MDDSAQDVYGQFQSTKFPIKNIKLDFNGLSFEQPKIGQFGPYSYTLKGDLILFNTVEEYKNANIQTIFSKERFQVQDLIF